jgi:hypothetical protein
VYHRTSPATRLISLGLGPTLGALLGATFYVLLKHVHYWRVNPNQDSTDVRESIQLRCPLSYAEPCRSIWFGARLITPVRRRRATSYNLRISP